MANERPLFSFEKGSTITLSEGFEPKFGTSKNTDEFPDTPVFLKTRLVEGSDDEFEVLAASDKGRYTHKAFTDRSALDPETERVLTLEWIENTCAKAQPATAA